MTQHDFDSIDQLLREERPANADEQLYIQLMAAAPRPDKQFVQSLASQFKPTKSTRTASTFIRPSAALVAVCLLVVGAVIAIDDLLSRALNSDDGLRAVRDDGKGVELNLTAEVEQFTIDIQWGYADPQRISLGYLIRAHDTQDYTNMAIMDNALLILADGREIPLRMAGLGLVEDHHAAGRLEATVADIPLPDELDARLSFRLAYAHDAHRTAVPLPPSGPTTQRLEDWMLQTPLVTLDLRLPVEHGYTIPLDLTAVDAGIEMRLREFQAAPSSGFARVCFTPPLRPAEEMWMWDAQAATLTYNGEPIVTWAGGRHTEGCADIRFTEGLPLEPGTWELTIREVNGVRTRLPEGPEWEATVTAAGGEIYPMEGGMGGMTLPAGADEAIGMRERIAGEWAFTFDAP